jgi:hypothetical protein
VSLAKALELATLDAARLGISIDDLEPPVASADGTAFENAGREYADTVHESFESRPSSAAGEAIAIAFIVGAKTARVAFDLPVRDDDPARDDTEFNLLLIETLMRQSQAIVAVLHGAAAANVCLQRAGAKLQRLIDRHLRSVRKEDRQVLAELIRAGRAPSPFCVTAPSPAARG